MSNSPTDKMFPNCGEGGDGRKWTSDMISRKLMAIFETPSIPMITPYATARRLGLLSISSGKNTKPWVIGCLIGGIAVLLAIFYVLVLVWCRRRLRRSVRLSNVQSVYTQFSYSQIVRATNNFDERRVIGEGGFGKVYLGTLEDGTTSIAIKKGSGLHYQGMKEFRAEIDLLLKLRHRGLISLLGYCDEKSQMILVYEYMGNGTLRQHLYGNNNPLMQRLTWIQRLEVARDAASGLHYLHTGSQRPIIHRDVKSSNILLDRGLVAKVSDFGLSKELPTMDMDNIEVSLVKGSFGYLDPEYQQSNLFTDKSDVYSFGVMLFELISSRPALDPTLPGLQVSLANWSVHCHQNNNIEQVIDPFLRDQISPECQAIYVGIAVQCLAAMGRDRPSMWDVLLALHSALNLQQNAGG